MIPRIAIEQIEEALIEEYGIGVWEAAEEKVRVEQGFLDGVKRKHPLLITATLEALYASGKQSELFRECLWKAS